MILPIYAYGMPVLRKKAENITPEYEGLSTLLENMFETMYDSSGIGLAAPQIGLPIRLFIVDGSDIEDDPSTKDFKKIFINAQILEEFDTAWEYEEGCLSIPFVRANVKRNAKVTIQYLDENFVQKTETYDGMAARIIQHEYDHIEGILFYRSHSPPQKKYVEEKTQQHLPRIGERTLQNEISEKIM
jgi:peptide deformylase